MDKVKRLVVIAAPSCCGKSTFVNKLINRELPQIEKSTGMVDASAWTYKDLWLHENELRKQKNSNDLELILHYTLPHPALKFILRRGYDKKVRLSILQASDNITLLTLVATPSTLVKRIQLRRERIFERKKAIKQKPLKTIQALRTLNRLHHIYSNPHRLTALYQKWFDVCSEFNTNAHFLVNVEQTAELLPLSKWPEVSHSWIDESSSIDK
jgi:GTPase SAR1 family protein